MRYLAKGFGLIGVPVMLAAIAGASQRALAEEIPFETIEEGSTSHFHDGNDCYPAGSQFVFKERDPWGRFWEAHSESYQPPPLPEVKFAQETVVAVLRGCQGGSEGPRIKIFRVEQIDRETRVHVLKYNAFGTDLAIGNAFHIVKIPRVKGSISFVHDEVWENARFCDGVTYANDCMRINAGVVLKHRGKCL